MYLRFFSLRKDMPHKRLQDFVVVDYTRKMEILAVIRDGEKENIIGLGQYESNNDMYTAEVALVVMDKYQNQGVGTELLSYLTILARKQGFLGFTGEVLLENIQMLRLFEKMGFDIEKRSEEGIHAIRMKFKESPINNADWDYCSKI